ncbi:MAG: EAL domain-containing protein [Acidobacteriaceae bacterium]
MRRSSGIIVAWVIGLTAVAVPIALSVHFARKQATEAEFAQLRGYAREILRRSDGSAQQSTVALRTLQHDNLPPCSPAEVDLMRQIALTSSYLQAVGRTAKGQLICSSLGVDHPISLGPIAFVTPGGAGIRYNARLPLTGGQPLFVFEKQGVASLVDPALPLDITTDSPDVAIAVISPEESAILTQRGLIHQRWLHDGAGQESDFIDRGILVTVLRSRSFDVGAVAAAPLTGLQQKVREVLFLFVPIGLLCGLAFAGAVFYLARVRFSMPGILRVAARRNEFFVEYQPIVDLQSRAWVGAEALVRWHRDGEVVRPDLFIPIAEETGIITRITARVLAQVAADLPAILALHSDFHIGINLAAADLQSPTVLDALNNLLTTSNTPPGNLVVEATERGFLQDAQSREVVARMREIGLAVAIDDFGTGYSSLARVQSLNLTHLKIDKSFVETIGTDGATSQVVQHIIEMGHSLNLKMVAEGVETEEQAQFLAERGVPYAQGWLFARSMELEAILTHLQESNLPHPESLATAN